MKTSVIIPAYNEEKYIKDCIEHALNQQEKFFEIIVVDNCSTDETATIAGKFENVKVVVEKQKGVTRARQRGFLESSGDIVAFLDADTRAPSDWHKKILNEFMIDPNVVCVSGPYDYYDISQHKGLLVDFYWKALARMTYFFVEYMAVGGNLAIRRGVFEKMGGFDTSIEFYGDDTDIARRASAFGKVLFTKNISVGSSARRLQKQGIIKTSWLYVINFWSVVILKKPVNKKYKDLR